MENISSEEAVRIMKKKPRAGDNTDMVCDPVLELTEYRKVAEQIEYTFGTTTHNSYDQQYKNV